MEVWVDTSRFCIACHRRGVVDGKSFFHLASRKRGNVIACRNCLLKDGGFDSIVKNSGWEEDCVANQIKRDELKALIASLKRGRIFKIVGVIILLAVMAAMFVVL